MYRNLTNTVFFICALLAAARAYAAEPVRGVVLDASSGEALAGAAVSLNDGFRWTMSDAEGRFEIGLADAGSHVSVSYLGYVTTRAAVPASGSEMTIRLHRNTLAIEEVVVTARQHEAEAGSSVVIDRNALDHLQMSSVSNVAALLPGGKTVNPDLTTGTTFSLRSGGSTAGNASFGTAVEIDGVRMGNNSSFAAPSGVETRAVAIADIESVEIITGVPSAEYGDLNGGMVKIRTRKGRAPWDINLSVNPRTYMLSFSKGFDLGSDNGTLNVGGEWAKAARKLTSPYTSYTRRAVSLAYANMYGGRLRLEAGLKANIGGMNSEDDPDAFTGEYTRGRDNLLQANTSLAWRIDGRAATNLMFDASVNFHDRRTHDHLFYSYASEQPSVHASAEGYFIADKLPYNFFSDRIVDSKEIDIASALRYELNVKGFADNRLKAGIQYRVTGNAGRGEYHENPALAPTGYRPRPYGDYPYMHNISVYAEDNLRLPAGSTELSLTAGVRLEKLHVAGAQYRNTLSLSPRFNARWRLTAGLTLRGGWGITEKMPSYYVLYPRQEYRDILTFGVSYDNNRSSYVYYTHPYRLIANPDLQRQRNYNSEIGLDASFAGLNMSLTWYSNRTKGPYKYSDSYTPFSYTQLQIPAGYTMPANPQIRVDNQSGMVYVRGGDEEYWTAMDVRVVDRTFIRNTRSDNGADIVRRGAELMMDFPEIAPLRTRFRVDAAYGYTHYIDDAPSYYYLSGWSHTSLQDRSYQYVGIYANGGSSTPVANGRTTHSLDANLTAITHIPRARIVITCRLEMSLVKRQRNLSVHDGREYAYKVSAESNSPLLGSIMSGDSYTAVRPVAYLDLDGTEHPFTDAEANNPDFAHLILKSNNAYTFAPDGYGPYFSANLSVTKEIGDHVSVSFFANNFTNSRRYVRSYATGVSAIFTPDFYYGLTCRIKF